MSEAEGYDYSATEPFLKPFTKWVKEEPFFDDKPELYGELWQFKSIVADWTFRNCVVPEGSSKLWG